MMTALHIHKCTDFQANILEWEIARDNDSDTWSKSMSMLQFCYTDKLESTVTILELSSNRRPISDQKEEILL